MSKYTIEQLEPPVQRGAGRPREADSVVIPVRIRRSDAELLRALSEEQDRPVSWLIRNAVRLAYFQGAE